jgi:hypothetical protein
VQVGCIGPSREHSDAALSIQRCGKVFPNRINIEDRRLGALAHERLDNRFSNTLGAADDHGHVVLELKVHAGSVPGKVMRVVQFALSILNGVAGRLKS